MPARFFLLLPVLAMLLASILAPHVRRLALAAGAIDHPGDRKVHAVALPRLGGLVVFGAIAGTFAAAALAGGLEQVFGPQMFRWSFLACGAVLVVLLGALDDCRSLTAGRKLVVQVVAAALVVASGCVVREVPVPGGGFVSLGSLAVPVTMAWVLGVTNALNLIDGLDGLAAGVALIVAGTLGLVSLSVGRPDAALVGFVLAGTLVGFLFFNFNPASIFLGDSGSLLLGYLLAVLGIESAHQGTTATFLVTPIVALGLPIVDTVLAIGRRLTRGLQLREEGGSTGFGRVVGSIACADREHIHHWLIAVGLTHRRAVLLLYAVCVVLNLTAVLVMRAEAVETTTMLTMVAVALFLGVRILGYRRSIDTPEPRPRMLQALADVAALVASYTLVALGVAAMGTLPPPLGATIEDAVVAAALTVVVLLVGGVYAPVERAGVLSERRLVATLAVALAFGAGSVHAIGVVPLGLWGIVAHGGVAATLLVASRRMRARRGWGIGATPTSSAPEAEPRLRVLQLGKFFHPHRGGIETYVKSLCDALRADVDLEVLVANTTRRTVREHIDGVPVTRSATLGRLRSTPITPLLRRHLGDARPDVVHLHAPSPIAELAFLTSPLARTVPLVVTWHSDVVRQRLLGWLWRPISRRLLARANAICVATPNHVTASSLLPAFADKIHVCTFGVDPDAARADDDVVRGLRERFGVRPIVLGIGRLVYYKGFDVLIEAVRSLDVTVVIVGDGPMRATLERRIRALGLEDRVHLEGEQADVAPYLALCDVFVLPSTHPSEAFGIVQLEAMAFGKPVVSTRLGTGVEWVNRHGESGLVVAPGDPDALRAALASLIADPVSAVVLGAQGARRLRREFTASKAAAEVLAVYQHVTGRVTAIRPDRPAPDDHDAHPEHMTWDAQHVG